MAAEWVLVVMAALATSACGRSASGGNPVPTAPTQTQPSPTTISEVARVYLDSLMETARAYSINSKTIDWASFRAEVFSTAGVAQTIADTYPAIGVALRLLDDYESYYSGSGKGGQIGPSPVGGCGAPTPAMSGLPDTVAYVKVGSCPCNGGAATQFAESIQQAIRTADRAGLSGWIVDLRGNFGGNMWPMIAGVGPVLGEGIIGWIVYNDREYEREYRAGGAQSFGEVFASVAAPYTLMKEDPRVAVLTDGGVVSAGEAVTVFFRGRPATRSFGTPTCGHHHLLEDFRLSDGATLSLVTARSADRTKTQYGGPIAPDEIISEPGLTLERAIAWLQSGH